MGKVNNNNYINIQGWMVTDLKLKGNDLLIYAIIYGFTQDGEQWFEGSRQYLAEWCNSTKQGVSKNLNSLVGKGYLLKEDKVINNVKFCKYKANLNFLSPDKVHGGDEKSSSHINSNYPPVNKVDRPGKQSCPPPGKQSLPNNTILNNLENNLDKENTQEKVFVDKNKGTCEEVVNLFNETCVSLPRVQKLTDARKKTLKSRLKKYSIEDFKKAFEKAENSSFLNGNTDKWSGATFDWLIKDSNLIKVLEGNYDDKLLKLNSKRKNQSYSIEEFASYSPFGDE